MALTQDLGSFVADVSFARLPQGAADVARTGFIDCIATMIAGAGDPAPQLLRKALHPDGRRGELVLHRREVSRTRGGVDQRHRRARARL